MTEARARTALTTSGGRSHGTSRNVAFDRWFRYPAGFASDYVGYILDEVGATSGTVVDCFSGSGVTGTAARQRGLGYQGIEAHPAIAELSALKVTPSTDADSLLRAGSRLLDQPQTVVDAAGETELVRRSFTPEVLGTLLSLRAAIVSMPADDPNVSYLKWALLATLRDVAGVKVGWPYQRPGVARTPRYSDVQARFRLRFSQMAEDLRSAKEWPDGPATVVIGDARDERSWKAFEEPAAFCVSSPPYLNNFDYADATRLELYFWKEVTTWSEMVNVVRADMLTATTQQSSVGRKAAALTDLRTRSGLSDIVSVVEELEDLRRLREGRTKEYDQAVPAYFLGIIQVLEHLRAGLRHGSKCAWLIGDSAPYGVYIDTPKLIGKCAETVGFHVTEDRLLRVRGNRWKSNADRHQIELSERLLIFEAV